MITAAKIIQNQKNILSERAKCTFCFVLIKQNLAQNVLRKGNNLFCRLYGQDRFSWTQTCAIIFICIGVYLVEVAESKDKSPDPLKK